MAQEELFRLLVTEDESNRVIIAYDSETWSASDRRANTNFGL
jgi:hypothetical protein